MRILLITATDGLTEKLSALSPELEYCAIVVDEVEPAKEILRRVGLPQDLIHPMEELQACVEGLTYDFVIPVQKNPYVSTIMGKISKYNVPKNKLLNLAGLHNDWNFNVKRRLQYYHEHAQEFEMFATGISPAWNGLDVTKFKRKLINLARPSQDLYYDFNIAKHIILHEERHNIRCALIGLAPYSFHYSLSKVFSYRVLLLQYLIAFNDIHDFFVPLDVYKTLFNPEYLARKLPLLSAKKIDIAGCKLKGILDKQALAKNTNTWVNLWYPKTRDENVKILDDYLTLCEQNNVRPIIFRVRVTKKYMANFNQQIRDEFDRIIEQALIKHPTASFFDGWQLRDFNYMDFNDHAHLNVQGAAKFSAYLNDFIERTAK